MQTTTFPNAGAIAVATADVICKQLKNKPDSLICIAAGHSSLPLFEELIIRYKNGQVDFSKAYFIAMDEWLHMNPSVPGSCGEFLNKHFLSHNTSPYKRKRTVRSYPNFRTVLLFFKTANK